MVKIDPAVAESLVEPETAVDNVLGHSGARRINDGWKGDFVADATAAAFQYGLLVSAKMLPQDRAEILLRFHFDYRKVEDSYWSSVYQSFLCGRDSDITHAELRERMFPAPANDNDIIYFEPTVFEWEDPATIPVRDWIYGKHLIRRHVSATIASGAVGKTSLKIVEALALATGRPLLGIDVPKRSRVWLFNLEDDMIELRRRVSAAMIHYGIKPEDLGDRLMIDGEKSLLITTTTREGTKISTPVVDAVVEAIEALEIDVLIVDPFISSHDAAESDSGAMDLVMKSGWVRVARDGDCAVELCHHTTKTDASSGMATAMSGRGSGAVVFACRSVMVLNKMSPDDAKKAGLESPAGYFSAIDDKENLTPESRLRQWYKMVGVCLGNGCGKGNLAEFRADNIGVVTRWDWPTNASFTEEVTADQLRAIKNRLMLGEHRKDAQAKAWAGFVVGDILALGSTKETMGGSDRQRIARMLDMWIEAGELEVYTAKIDRQDRPCIRTA
jgi:AAA domain